MKGLIFDPFAGIAGDMILGALVDLGRETVWLEGLGACLGLEGVSVQGGHVDRRGITSSNGETQVRYVIKTPLRIGDLEFRAEISLADRSDMKFPMLIGRSALRRRFVVDSGHSWLQTPGLEVEKGYKP